MSRFQKRPLIQAPGVVKRWVYKQGFRPGPDSPFFSESINTRLQAEHVLRQTLAGLRGHIAQTQRRMGDGPPR